MGAQTHRKTDTHTPIHTNTCTRADDIRARVNICGVLELESKMMGAKNNYTLTMKAHQQ